MFKLPKPALTVIFLCFGVANVAAEVGKPLTAFAMYDGVGDTYRSADFEGKILVLYHFGFDLTICYGTGPSIEKNCGTRSRTNGCRSSAWTSGTGARPAWTTSGPLRASPFPSSCALPPGRILTGRVFPSQTTSMRQITAASGAVSMTSSSRTRRASFVSRGESIDLAAKAIVELIDRPGIETRVESLNLGSGLESGLSRTFTFEVVNSGTAPLEIVEVRSDLPEFTANVPDVSIPPGEGREIEIVVVPAQEGPLFGTVSIFSNDPDLPVLRLPVSGEAVVRFADPRADFDGSSDVDFLNFVSFAQAFDGTDPAFDLDANGRVDFGDLIIFAKSFDRPLGCTV